VPPDPIISLLKAFEAVGSYQKLFQTPSALWLTRIVLERILKESDLAGLSTAFCTTLFERHVGDSATLAGPRYCMNQGMRRKKSGGKDGVFQ
jgi:hypothetical protein